MSTPPAAEPPPPSASASAVAELLEHHLPGLRFVVGGLAIALGIAALHFGKPLLAPLVLAALLAFALTPAVALLRRLHVPHVPAVMLVIVALVSLCLGLGFVMGQQMLSLSRDLPSYQETVRDKLRALRPTGQGPWQDGLRMIGVVEGELDATRRALAPKAAAPQRVQVEPAPPSPLRTLAAFAAQVLLPLAQIGLMVVLLFFMLLQRHEIRDRLLRLLGQDLARSAETLDEAGDRVSRYLVAQLMVNTCYAVPLGLGLWVIGVPGAWLWGLLGGALRFVPYLGPVVASVCPLLLAFAVDPGWHMVGMTLGLIVGLELLLNNFVEPLAYGQSTGVSSLAVLLSAGFWSLVWGLEGLAIATPLTVCLLVLGRDLGPLRMLDPLLGAKPVFDAPTRLHQRLATGALEDALEQVDDVSTPEGLMAFYDEAALGALRLLADASHGPVGSLVQRQRVLMGMERLLNVMQRDGPAGLDGDEAAGPTVLCIGARSEADNLSARMLAHLLRAQGVRGKALPASALTAEQIAELPLQDVAAVCLCSFHPAPLTQARFALHRLRRRQADLPLLLGAWAAEVEPSSPEQSAELGTATSLQEALQLAQEAVASYLSVRFEPICRPLHEA
ncbi:AI-2E family transporter [Burkholderiaceae bacterium UC74_6]